MALSFSPLSTVRLETCDPKLRRLFLEVLRQGVDCTILCGHRGKDEQDEAVRTGKSKTPWPTSKHNSLPSRAVDVAPYPVEWPSPSMGIEVYARALGRWYLFAGYVRATADRLGIRVRYGADWDGDFEVKDQNFHYLPHWELLDD